MVLDSIEDMAGQQSQNTNANVAGGLMQALDEPPGGLAGLISSFQVCSGRERQAMHHFTPQGVRNSGLSKEVA
jgi:hypothetical protein